MIDKEICFSDLTESFDDLVSSEQMGRIAHRYVWAEKFCRGKDVVELACGSGIGVRFLEQVSRSILGFDIDPQNVHVANKICESQVSLADLNHSIPLETNSIDVCLLFEAHYYIRDFDLILREIVRVLRPGGKLLLVSANPSLYDFVASPLSTNYFGVKALSTKAESFDFSCNFYGLISCSKIALRQRFLRPFKALAGKARMVPSTLKAKYFLKRIFFGKLKKMPLNLNEIDLSSFKEVEIPSTCDDLEHKVIYLHAEIGDEE